MSSNERQQRSLVVGRGAQIRPGNRFEKVHQVDDWEQLNPIDDPPDDRRVATQFFADQSQSILAENDSPDVCFRYSINAYRGCEHGCAYCYARPGHEFLGMNAGLDFETKVLVKYEAPRLLRAALNKRSWRGEVIVMSGVTDCYQPAERKLRLTRGLLEVMLEANQACGLITKNALVARDIDLLGQLAERRLVHANLSITTLRPELARSMEPRTSPPQARLDAIRRLTAAGVPVRVMVAPIVPGLNDSEIPAILQAAQQAGAGSAGYVLLRLPHAVRPVFEDWLARERPLENDRVTALIRSTRGGAMSNSEWGTRLRGDGPYADQIASTFKVFSQKFGLHHPLPDLDTSQFRPPRIGAGQMRMF